MTESRWWYLLHKEVKSWYSTTWFRIWQFQTPAQKRYLQMHLLAEPFVSGRWLSGFPERGNQGLSIGTNFGSQLAKLSSVFTSIVYGDNIHFITWITVGKSQRQRGTGRKIACQATPGQETSFASFTRGGDAEFLDSKRCGEDCLKRRVEWSRTETQ